MRKGNGHLKTALVTAAVAVAKTRGSCLGEKHRRLRTRRGEMRARVAIAHGILVAAYRIMSTGSDYRNLGPTYLDTIDKRRTTGQLARRLRDMGYEVDIKPNAA